MMCNSITESIADMVIAYVKQASRCYSCVCVVKSYLILMCLFRDLPTNVLFSRLGGLLVNVFVSCLAVSVPLFRKWRLVCLAGGRLQYRSKLRKGSKNCYLLGQDAICLQYHLIYSNTFFILFYFLKVILGLLGISMRSML